MKNMMSKLISVAIITSCSVSMAFAKDHIVKITLECPDIGTKGAEIVTNYGTYLAGAGTERVNSDAPTFPLFQSPMITGLNIPFNLATNGYINDGVSYNATNGAVVCKYTSSMGFDGFYLSTVMHNARNGRVVSSSAKIIHLQIPVGSP
jgi:hypothetical protein